MSFVSVAFFVLFAVVLAAEASLRSSRARQAVLLAASYVFYGWWDWRFCFLMLLLTAVAYSTALLLEKRPGDRRILAAGVAFPLAVLFYFKYMGFFVDAFASLFHIRTGALSILLPVGISFYTFQALSYTIDVYRRRIPVSHDPVKFALYISFFPQLVAGPIVKAGEFLPQLEQDRRPTRESVSRGIVVFFWGMLKKAVLADRLSVFVDGVYAAPAAFSSGTIALAVLAYALQIYFDFSGYSDMAVGCAGALGYDLPRNFDLPYLAKSVREFWKRWHISLSSWLMEYLYIPLGGNRKGRARTMANLLLTMALGGLWHGAGLNFILWGVVHGAALCACRARSGRRTGEPGKIASAAGGIATFLFVTLAWVLFRAPDPETAGTIYRKLFLWTDGVVWLYSWLWVGIAAMALFTLYGALRGKDARGAIHETLPTLPLSTFGGCFAFCLLVGFTLLLLYTGENPFIYFQF